MESEWEVVNARILGKLAVPRELMSHIVAKQKSGTQKRNKDEVEHRGSALKREIR